MRIHSGVVVPAFIFSSQTHGDPASATACRIFFRGEGRPNQCGFRRCMATIKIPPTTLGIPGLWAAGSVIPSRGTSLRDLAAEGISCGIRIPLLSISCSLIDRQVSQLTMAVKRPQSGRQELGVTEPASIRERGSRRRRRTCTRSHLTPVRLGSRPPTANRLQAPRCWRRCTG